MQKKRILLSVTPEEKSMALVDNGVLQEYVIERENSDNLVGNIFKGQVKNILKGIQSLFIDIGKDKNVFLYNSKKTHFHEGENVLVQIVKDAMGTKGARASTDISLPGKYVVLLPYSDYIGISKSILDEEEKERLKNIVEEIKPSDVGVIVRTAANNAPKEVLEKDVLYLLNTWETLQNRFKREKNPALLYREADLPIRIVRDYLNDDIDEFIIDNNEVHSFVKEYVDNLYPNYSGKIIYHDKNIYADYKIDEEISKISSRIVPLECGGYIVFDYTEAFTVVDVNTGSYKGGQSIEHTALNVNTEAAKEIARQLRLRDIGGIIIIDFIDMTEEENKETIIKVLEEEVLKDKMSPKVLGITSLGLIEMTRKKMRQNTSSVLFSACPFCSGSGYVKSPETICVEIIRKIRSSKKIKKFLLQAHPSVTQWFINNELKKLSRDVQIKIQGIDNMHPEAYSLLSDIGE